MASRRCWSAGCLTLALLAPGCASPNTYVASSLSGSDSLWMALAIRSGADVLPQLSEVVRESAARELEATGRFHCLELPGPASSGKLSHAWAEWDRGPPPRALVRLAREHGLDALGLLSIREYDPYPPIRVSLAVEIHSTETGALLFASSKQAMAVRGPSSGPIRALVQDRFIRSVTRDLLEDVR